MNPDFPFRQIGTSTSPWVRPPKGSKVGKRPLQKTKKTIGKTTLCDMGNPHSQNLIKHVVHWDFLDQFGGMTSKSMKIPLCLSVKRYAFFGFRKTWKTVSKMMFCANRKMSSGNLINHVVHGRFWGRPRQKVSKSHEKALRLQGSCALLLHLW